MAAENSIISEVKKQELDDTTSCCICTDVFTDPKLLPCMHTFCLKCLQENGLKTNKGPGDEMPCPICRRQFKIPPEGFHGLPNNSFIEKLIQVENILDQSVLSKDVCDACLEENEEETKEQIPAANAYCVECRQKLCEECCRHHRKLKLTKNHKLVLIKELQKSGESVMNLEPCVCELHEQKVLDVYCVKCNAVVCAICFIDDHKNHEGSHVSKFVKDFRQLYIIEIHTESMNDCSTQAQRKKAELLKVKEDMQQKVERLESDVVNRKDELKQLADAHAHSILQGISVLQRNKLKEIEVAAGEVDAYLSVLDSFKTRCQKVMAQGTPSHICRSASNLSSRAAALQQQCQSLVEQDIESFTICFKKSELEEFLQSEGGNLIGEIGGERDPKPKESSKREQMTIKVLEANAEKLKQDLNSEKTTSKALQTEVKKLKQDLNSEKTTRKALQAEVEKHRQKLDSEKKFNESLQADLDQLKQKIVTERKSAKEELEKTKTADLRYKSDPVLVQRIGTRAVEEGKKWISGLAILDKEFFVVSGESSEVEVYDLMKLSFSRRWNLKALMNPGDLGSCKRNKCLYILDSKSEGQSKEILKIAPSGKLIKKWSTGRDSGFSLSVSDESNVILTVKSKNKLNEYSPDGQLIREVTLSSVAGILCPLFALKLANGHFVVSHGRGAGELHRVCVVDAEVKLKNSFGGKPGSTAENVNRPVQLVIDGNGFVMVVDRGNSRVLLLDSDLQFKREILSKERHGLRSPYGIYLDETNGRLFVVDSKLESENKLFKDAPISIFDF